jgi:FKBP-type peptidyl-prolyl cis-trans isomerase SlyD
MKISHHKAVTVNYTLSDDSGQIMDTSEGGAPLFYVHGTNGIIPGFETALDGHSPKDSFSFRVEPKDAYGEYNESLVFALPKERFAEVDNLQEGMQFAVNGPGGGMVMTVTGIGDKDVTLDGNHPLAGSTLNFQVEVLEVRDATPEEIEESLSDKGCGCSAGPEEDCGCGCSGPAPDKSGCSGCSQ